MPQSAAYVAGLAEFRQALAALHPEWPRALTDAHRNIGNSGAKWARAEAASMGGIWNRSKSAIGGEGFANEARISVFPSKVDAMASAAFVGARKHSGWYVRARYRNSTPQFPPWIDQNWEVGVAGQGPYAINNAIAKHLDELLEEYLLAIDELAQKAFPQGG